jgi:hypothetical protein
MAKTAKKASNRWSTKVTKNSNALDLEKNVFTWKDPHKIALSLKKSAEQSNRRKTSPFASAMSMLNFYLNRAGKNMEAGQKTILQKSKDELRRIFNKE